MSEWYEEHVAQGGLLTLFKNSVTWCDDPSHLHRTGGPVIIQDVGKPGRCPDGRLHREDGPARVIFVSYTSIHFSEYFLRGQELTKYRHAKLMAMPEMQRELVLTLMSDGYEYREALEAARLVMS